MPKKIEFHFKSPNDSPGYLLSQLAMLLQRKQKRVLDPLDLTHTQFVLLAALGWLARENETVTQIDIATQANLDRMMVSKVLRTLENKKFISRQEHKTDTRAKSIQLTKSGEEILQKAVIEVERADIEFFATLKNRLPMFNESMVDIIAENKQLL